MTADHFSVGVVVVKRALKNPWASHAWLPLAILPAVPDAPPWTCLASQGGDETWYAGASEITLHAAATGHYRDNLTAAQPSLWVVLRPVGDEVELVSVLADPYEGEALAESIGAIVEPVPMPLDVQRRVQAFFEAFHVERQFFKRKRDRADPEAMARRGVAGPASEDSE
jgi:hypothetical protein